MSEADVELVKELIDFRLKNCGQEPDNPLWRRAAFRIRQWCVELAVDDYRLKHDCAGESDLSIIRKAVTLPAVRVRWLFRHALGQSSDVLIDSLFLRCVEHVDGIAGYRDLFSYVMKNEERAPPMLEVRNVVRHGAEVMCFLAHHMLL